ncbi:MAG: hypothetical protein NUV91_05160 [Candidatus Omnitrophica bacterium]|nr:hypothetical protein [Candidatus Omnitrophota bacterium]
MLNEDYRDILQSLLRNKAKFLVVGAYAMGMHGYPRATGDFDIWVEASIENSKKVFQSLIEFGAPIEGIRNDTFAQKAIVLQIGVPPRRIDIITEIDGVEFDEAYLRKNEIEIAKLSIPFLSKEDLIKNKESTGRDKDKLDAKNLKKK